MHASIILSALALFPLAMTAPSQRLPREDATDATPFDAEQQFDAAARPVDVGSLFDAPDSPDAPQFEPRQEDSRLCASTANPDMKLVLVAIGHGTQNYTCATATAVPAAIGAVAQLFNTTCNTSSNTKREATDALGSIRESASESAAIGAHFFLDSKTPDFDIKGLGNTETAKLQDTPAPNPAKDVKWLRLGAKAGSTSAVKAIYRLNTQGGLAPATCEGKTPGEVLAIKYTAQYWFYT
ncbi:hypothetical protein CFE70_003392 [Pyrenophora teres f. teres 0-1]